MKVDAFKLERYFAKYEFTTRFLLSSSDCESLSMTELFDLEPSAREKFEKLTLNYTDSQGSLELRHEIAKIYQMISPENVLVQSGAQEAIFLFLNSVLAPHDEIIVQTPCYQSFSEIPKSLRCKVIPWEAKETNNWSLVLNDLQRLLSPTTKVLVVNFPHNPTGTTMSEAHFRDLCLFAESRGIILLSDEVYRESEYAINTRLPAACDLSPAAVSIGVMSKTYGLPGLRIGWLATRNKKVLARMAQLKDYTTICNSVPSEFLAALALRHRQKLIARNLEIIHNNLEYLDLFFEKFKDFFSWVRPTAGCITFPKIIKSRIDADVLCDKLVREKSVLLLPGSVFGAYPQNFRLGFGRANMPEALELFENFLIDLDTEPTKNKTLNPNLGAQNGFVS